MGTALVKDILYRAALLLGDAATQFTAFPEREVVQYLNEGQIVVCKLAPWASSRVDALKLTANQSRQSIAAIASGNMIPQDGSAAANVRGLLLTELICNMGSNGTTEGNAIRLADVRTLGAVKPSWPTVTGAVITEYVYDPRYPTFFMVSPQPTSAIWVLAAYQALPVAIPAGGAPGSELYAFAGSSTQTITIDDRFQDDLVNYVYARCLLKLSEQQSKDLGVTIMNLVTASISGHVQAMGALTPGAARKQ